jgi:DNA-directed RNA polymerase specialized sigma24 family protein
MTNALPRVDSREHPDSAREHAALDLDPKTFFRRFARHTRLLGDIDPKHVDLAELYAMLAKARPGLARRSDMTGEGPGAPARGAGWHVPPDVTRKLRAATIVTVRNGVRIHSCPPDPRLVDSPPKFAPVEPGVPGAAPTTGEGIRETLRQDRDAILDAIALTVQKYRKARDTNALPDTDADIKNWVRGSAKGYLRNRTRYHALRIRDRVLHAPSTDDDIGRTGGFEETLPSERHSPEELAENREAIALVAETFDEPQQRAVVMSVQGHSSEEIGAVVGLSAGGVRNLLFKIRGSHSQEWHPPERHTHIRNL